MCLSVYAYEWGSNKERGKERRCGSVWLHTGTQTGNEHERGKERVPEVAKKREPKQQQQSTESAKNTRKDIHPLTKLSHVYSKR